MVVSDVTSYLNYFEYRAKEGAMRHPTGRVDAHLRHTVGLIGLVWQDA